MAMRAFQIIIAAMALASVLSGCAKPDDQVCASYGYEPGTPGFGNCMMQREQQRMQAASMFLNVKQQQQQQNQQLLFQQQMNAIQNSTYRPSTTNTTCFPIGNTLSCNSTSY
jgi:hypothetical protein